MRAFLERRPESKGGLLRRGNHWLLHQRAFWDRGIVITSAYAANAVPVAEYTLPRFLLA